MMMAGHPLRLFAGIFDIFKFIEPPDDLAIPVHLHHVQEILHAVLGVAFSGRPQDMTAGQHFVGQAVQALP